MIDGQLDGKRNPVSADFIPGDSLAGGSKPFGQLLLRESQSLPGFLEIIQPHVTNRYTLGSAEVKSRHSVACGLFFQLVLHGFLCTSPRPLKDNRLR